ncbi:MAG: hypothetical protein EOO75_12525 [Myxococcales bacterium]|nr:MAG: hypothetical protein EOO75_12525 [Myxococcales bacterium]
MTEFVCPHCAHPGQADVSGERVVTLTTCAHCQAELIVEYAGLAFDPDDYEIQVQCYDCGDIYWLGGESRGRFQGKAVRAVKCTGHCHGLLMYEEVTGEVHLYVNGAVKLDPKPESA